MTDQETVLTHVIHPCPGCGGTGCDFCMGEQLIAAVIGDRFACHCEDRHQDMDGTYMSVQCPTVAQVGLRVRFTDEHEAGRTFDDMLYVCQKHAGEFIAGLVNTGAPVVELSVQAEGYEAHGEPWIPADEDTIGCPHCALAEGMTQEQAYNAPQATLPQRAITKIAVVDAADPTEVYTLSCGHTYM